MAMESIRLAWAIWRLARYVQKNRVEGACASIDIYQEKESSPTYQQMKTHYAAHGMPPPPPRELAEVAVWLDIGAPHTKFSGRSVRHALERALEET
jgi:hypothetical protein